MANILGILGLIKAPRQVVMGIMAALVLSLGLVLQTATPALATGSGLRIIKYTNGVDANTPAEGPQIPVAPCGKVHWTYEVSLFNAQEDPPWDSLKNIVVQDDDGNTFPNDPNFFPDYVSGDVNLNNFLDDGEVWLYEAFDLTPVLGQYANEARVKGDTLDNDTSFDDTDPSHYTGVPCKANPTISTTPSAGGIVGVTLNDAAALSGGNTPTGTVTFKLYPPSDAICSGAASYTDADATAPYDTATSGGGFVSNAVGIWHWTADYSGDANNNPASSGCTAEPVTVDKANPTISTLQSAGGIVGVTLNDTAALAGGNTPTGTVTFKLYPPSDPNCAGAASYTDADATAPYDTATSGGGFVSNAVGVWHWTADYSGDANNNPASSGCAAEPVTVEEPAALGRMTGGGSVFTVLGDTPFKAPGIRVTHGFEIHCDVTHLPNRLQINWKDASGKAQTFHLESLTTAVCTDDPAIDQKPPQSAPFDTFIGTGIGRYNGVSGGATIQFTFTDYGEPGKQDTATYKITTTPGGIDVLVVSAKQLKVGNHQTHKD